MKQQEKKLIAFFNKEGSILQFSSILKEGFHSDTLKSLETQGLVEKISRGFYKLIDSTPLSQPDIVLTSLRAPQGVLCLISALSFHEATQEIPRVIHWAIPEKSYANKIDYPPVQFYRFAQPIWEVGIQEHLIDGQTVQVYNLAKTVCDCFRFRNKIGINIAREALDEAVRNKGVASLEIMTYAKICRVTSLVQPLLEQML